MNQQELNARIATYTDILAAEQRSRMTGQPLAAYVLPMKQQLEREVAANFNPDQQRLIVSRVNEMTDYKLSQQNDQMISEGMAQQEAEQNQWLQQQQVNRQEQERQQITEKARKVDAYKQAELKAHAATRGLVNSPTGVDSMTFKSIVDGKEYYNDTGKKVKPSDSDVLRAQLSSAMSKDDDDFEPQEIDYEKQYGQYRVYDKDDKPIDSAMDRHVAMAESYDKHMSGHDQEFNGRYDSVSEHAEAVAEVRAEEDQSNAA